jgi:hypothetical protein
MITMAIRVIGEKIGSFSENFQFAISILKIVKEI